MFLFIALCRRLNLMCRRRHRFNIYVWKTTRERCSERGLEINIDKTEYMVIGSKDRDLIVDNNNKIKYIESYTYLGTSVTNSEGSNDVMNLAKVAIRQLDFLIWSNKLSNEMKRIIYKTIVQSFATYTTEIWEITESQKPRQLGQQR